MASEEQIGSHTQREVMPEKAPYLWKGNAINSDSKKIDTADDNRNFFNLILFVMCDMGLFKRNALKSRRKIEKKDRAQIDRVFLMGLS